MGVSSLSGTNTIKAFFIFQISFGRQDGGEDTFFLCLRCFNTGRIQNRVLTTLPFLFLKFPGFKDKISKYEVTIQWGIHCFTKGGTLKSDAVLLNILIYNMKMILRSVHAGENFSQTQFSATEFSAQSQFSECS